VRKAARVLLQEARALGVSTPRPLLSRQCPIETVVAVADERAVTAVRQSRRAARLRAMSLYHHVTNKDTILDGIVGTVCGEVEPPESGLD
jgi:hypothetical protein